MKRVKRSTKYLIGIDEAGRGPLAGPVSVGVVIINTNDFKKRKKWFNGIKDSKKLSEKSREEWFAKIKKAKHDGWMEFVAAFGSARAIDKIGINRVIRDAINRALLKLVPDPRQTKVLLDGGLRAPTNYIFQETIIKGDEKEPTIAAASIVAKVSRDRLMKKTAKKYPRYDFEKHKGYGTPGHYQKIKRHGPSPIHRRSFLKNMS